LRVKLMMHYATSFFMACLIIVVINIFYMRSYVYKEDDVQTWLKEQSIGLQLLNKNLEEVGQWWAPSDTQGVYEATDIITLYEREDVTVFIEPFQLGDGSYTMVLFMDATQIKRKAYTYDAVKVGAAYNVYWLIGLNLFVLIMFSYMYTYSMTRPVHLMIERIMNLARGDYDSVEPGKGIYSAVEQAMNDLGGKLEVSRLEREQADAAREEWLSNLTHDIKTPLTAIMGYGELIGDLDYALSPIDRSHYSKVILDKGHYIETLVSDLNLVTRLKHHQLRLQVEWVDMVAEVKAVLIGVLNKDDKRQQDYDVALTYTSDAIWAQLDRHLFKRVLINLVNNAFVHNTFSAKVQSLSVKVHVDGGDSKWIELVIDDDGVGVKPEELSRIFTRYYRGTHTRLQSEGSGLGLAITHEIVRAHKGVITAQESPYGGLRLIIKFRRTLDETVS